MGNVLSANTAECLSYGLEISSINFSILAARLRRKGGHAAEVYANVVRLYLNPTSTSHTPSTVLGLKVVMSTESVSQPVMLADMTSSKTGTFYFAYGSNLSPSQMSLRLRADPASSKPVAVARLDAHAWIICERGYANVVALPEMNKSAHENVVWGIVYNLSAQDEARLDMFEGHDELRNPSPKMNPDPSQQQRRPYLQNGWDYNKHYLPVTVTKWLAEPGDYGLSSASEADFDHDIASIRVLVYVDELRTRPGKINQEYIGRMNRGIRECIDLGVPQQWINATMRQHIPAGVEVDHDGYVGTDKGYIEAEATETASDLKERVLRDLQGSGM